VAQLERLRRGDPRRVGPYRVRARIGAGGMGVVYLARRRHRTVAVKVLRVDLASSDAFRTRFEREIAAARRITGQGVPALLDADARAVRPWFATEFVPGETLEAFVAEHGALDGPALRAFAVGVADALATIAQAGLVHRDLKPTNVLLTREGLTVLDLGVALDLEAVPLTRTGQRVGTRRWMAPEQVRGTARHRQRTCSRGASWSRTRPAVALRSATTTPTPCCTG